jgi:hypothetical protein
MSEWDTVQAMLAGIPDLPGARCKGRADLFERTVGGRREESGRPAHTYELENARAAALRLCAACPALDPCRVWLDGQRLTRRPRGVVAGQVITSTGEPSKTWTTNP